MKNSNLTFATYSDAINYSDDNDLNIQYDNIKFNTKSNEWEFKQPSMLDNIFAQILLLKIILLVLFICSAYMYKLFTTPINEYHFNQNNIERGQSNK